MLHNDFIFRYCSQICPKNFNDHLSWHRVTGIHGVTVDHRKLDAKAMWEVSTLYMFTITNSVSSIWSVYWLCKWSNESDIKYAIVKVKFFLSSFLFSSIQVFASIVMFTCHKCLTLRSFYANCLRISPVFCASGHAIAFVLWRCKYLFRFLPTIFLL